MQATSRHLGSPANVARKPAPDRPSRHRDRSVGIVSRHQPPETTVIPVRRARLKAAGMKRVACDLTKLRFCDLAPPVPIRWVPRGPDASELLAYVVALAPPRVSVPDEDGTRRVVGNAATVSLLHAAIDPEDWHSVRLRCVEHDERVSALPNTMALECLFAMLTGRVTDLDSRRLRREARTCARVHFRKPVDPIVDVLVRGGAD